MTPLRIRVAMLAWLWWAVAGGALAQAEAPVAPELSRQALQADLVVLRDALEALHPGLERYTTPAQRKQAYTALADAWSRDQSLRDAHIALARFTAFLRCGHTYANFYNQPEDHQRLLYESGSQRVPFAFRWVDGEMVVTQNHSGHEDLAPGARVQAVDGVPTATLLKRLLPLVRGDGHNDAQRFALLEVQGDDEYETFDVMLPWVLPSIGERMTFDVVPPRQHSSRRAEVGGLTFQQRRAFRRAPPSRDEPQWTLRREPDGLAVLTMPTWALYNSAWDWKAYLQSTFDALAKAPPSGLVIDLRGNEGGQDVGDDLLAHLITEPVTRPVPSREVRYQHVPSNLRQYLDTWDPGFMDWGTQARPLGNGRYALMRPGDVGSDRITPALPHFAGPVFVLIGARNSSATFEFAQQVQATGLATLVGQPTGGNLRGINGGAFFFLRLPRTRIEVDIPLIKQTHTPLPADAGLIPDIVVALTSQRFAEAGDPELQAVRDALTASSPCQLTSGCGQEGVTGRLDH